MPERIVMRRSKRWVKPEGTVYIARPSKWGNPYHVGMWDPDYVATHEGRLDAADPGSHIESAVRANELYLRDVVPGLPIEELVGRDVACWCSLDHPCHGDVLLALAAEVERAREVEG